ncbi:MAG: hypothetical protein ACI9MC_001132 [Kiritimatiellia bacterium]|jgi:hypothetical protein
MSFEYRSFGVVTRRLGENMSTVDFLVNALVFLGISALVPVVFIGALLIAIVAVKLKWSQLQTLATLDHRFTHAGRSFRLVVPGAKTARLAIDGSPCTIRTIERQTQGGVHSLRTYAFEFSDLTGEIAVRYESWRPRSAEVRVANESVFRTIDAFS